MYILIHSKLKHQHIIELEAHCQDEQYIYLIMEYATGGELFDKIGTITYTGDEDSINLYVACYVNECCR